MTDDGMTTPIEVDPITMLAVKMEELQKKLDEIATENVQLKSQNSQIAMTNARLLMQQPAAAPEPEPRLDVEEVAYQSFIKELLRGRTQ